MFYYISKNQDFKNNKYSNADNIEPFTKKKEDLIYFWVMNNTNIKINYYWDIFIGSVCRIYHSLAPLSEPKYLNSKNRSNVEMS